MYCHSRYSMNRIYEYATDKIYNLVGNEGYKYWAHCYKWWSVEMSDDSILIWVAHWRSQERDKSAKVIGYKDEVIRILEWLLLHMVIAG